MADIIFIEVAKAKINLTLHVGRPISDTASPFYRYHPLDSLVMFADMADKVSVQKTSGSGITLKISGPFGADLDPADPSNLILKACESVSRIAPLPGLSFTLEKNLPVSSGIGGGSADAAATLRLLRNFVDLSDAQWHEFAVSLGADVPVCFKQNTAHMTGIGECLSALPDLGTLYAVLVNPNIAVSTGAVFKDFDASGPKETPSPQRGQGSLLERALDGRNDLEPVTRDLLPKVSQVLEGLAQTKGCKLARMSGSGATCFGIYKTLGAAKKAADHIQKEQSNWWVKATVFGDVQFN